MRDKMKKVCCLGMCLLLFLTAGCREKETLTLEEVEERHTEQSTKEKECEDAKTKQPEEAAGQAEEVRVCTSFIREAESMKRFGRPVG